ncbi:hypothetical protein G6F37_014169 [Rhizopus arrhizus]|nr:hypothetical protein G6F37_014169 [Rhizopus arrhizus]
MSEEEDMYNDETMDKVEEILLKQNPDRITPFTEKERTVGQKTDARNCKIPVLQLVVYGYCTKLSQTLIVCTSLERAFIRRLSDMGNDYWWNLRLLKGIL